MVKVRGIFYGWWVAIAGLTYNYYQAGTFWYGFGAFFGPIVDHFGWTRAATSVAFSIQQSETGMFAPFVGYLIDKFGPRRVMVVGTTITGFGFIILSRVNSLATLYAAMAILALGMSLGSYIVISACVANWFNRLQGRALAIFTSGAGLAGTLVPLVVFMIDWQGWRTSLVIVGIGTWLIGIPLSLILRKRPEDYGMLPDGDPPGGPTIRPTEGARRPRLRFMTPGPRPQQADFTAREAMRTPSFWLMAATLALGFFAMSGLIVHLIPAQESIGIGRGAAALTVTMLTLLSLVGRWTGGFLVDYLDERHIMSWGYLFQGIGILILAFASEYWHVILFLVFYAPGFGATVPIRVVMQARFFGRKALGTLMGILATMSTMLTIFAPIYVGWIYDVFESYRLAFITLGITSFATIPLLLINRRPLPPKTMQTDANVAVLPSDAASD